MFDWYEPREAVGCPVCGAAVEEWQGKDGPNELVVWRQGEPRPVAQRVDTPFRWSAAELARLTLPERFEIQTSCRGRLHHPVRASCRCQNGIWTAFELLPVPGLPESVEDYY